LFLITDKSDILSKFLAKFDNKSGNMKMISYGSTALWNTVLLFSVVFAVFALPVLPAIWHKSLFRLIYTIIYFSAILSLEKRGNYLLVLFFSTLLIEWISGIFNLEVLFIIAKAVNIIFFFVIVTLLIRQIATAGKVSSGVILGSVTGYLLLGLIFSIFVIFIMQNDPGAFSAPPKQAVETEESINTSVPLYFSFVTLATLGYGDIVPLKPYTRSLATLISVTGQFYIAIIVALLVGKFSSQRDTFTDE
jgi:voltage-gated potassium channel